MTGTTIFDEQHAGGVAPIVAALEDEIVSARWPAGSKLPSERNLAEMLGVSRPMIREALRALNERGLINIYAGRGSFVRTHRPTDNGASAELLVRRGEVTARHLIDARIMLESRAAELAALNRTDAQLAEMRKLLDAFDGVSVSESAVLDLAFHESIAIASHNPVLQVMFGSIKTLTHGIILRSLTDRHVTGAAMPLHDVIFNAIADRDAVAASRAMSEHLAAAEKYYGDDLDKPLAGVLDQRADRTPSLAAVLRSASKSILNEASEPFTTIQERIEQNARNQWKQQGQ